jgi:hypothetical protein
MTNFEGLKDLFNVLKIKHITKKHWMDFLGWGIVEFMNELLLESTQNVIVVANFISVSNNEFIAINKTFWIFFAFICCSRLETNFALGLSKEGGCVTDS